MPTIIELALIWLSSKHFLERFPCLAMGAACSTIYYCGAVLQHAVELIYCVLSAYKRLCYIVPVVDEVKIA